MASNKAHPKFVVCIQSGEAGDLEARKIYQSLPDEDAARVGYVRIIDESGEDYLYPAKWFLPITLTDTVEKALLAQP